MHGKYKPWVCSYIVRLSKISKSFDYSSVSEYYKMPDMYSLEPYDRCMNENAETESVFCLVHAMIEANTSNPTWNIIHVSWVEKRKHIHFQYEDIRRVQAHLIAHK